MKAQCEHLLVLEEYLRSLSKWDFDNSQTNGMYQELADLLKQATKTYQALIHTLEYETPEE